MSPGQQALEHGTGTLADLIADARAIPAAAYGVQKKAAERVIDLVPRPREVVIRIPEAAADLMHRAEQAFADYLR
jgi:hypothetical protein